MVDWKVTILIGIAALLLGAAGALAYAWQGEGLRSEKVEVGEIGFLTLDASRRSIMVKQGGKFCSEPVPDAANTFAKEFATKVAGAIADEKAAASLKQVLNTELTKLFERSQGIQALRDGMYRLCEAYLNNAIQDNAYQDHIGDLTATLNFIVPFELCAKLNREIVVALATMPPIEVPDGDHHQQEPKTTDSAAKAQMRTSLELAERRWRTEWAATITNSELLSSKFTNACMTLGSDFAIKLAGAMATRANTRDKIRTPVVASIPAMPSPLSPLPTTQSSAQLRNPFDPYAATSTIPHDQAPSNPP
jgi:hypothetical protein